MDGDDETSPDGGQGQTEGTPSSADVAKKREEDMEESGEENAV